MRRLIDSIDTESLRMHCLSGDMQRVQIFFTMDPVPLITYMHKKDIDKFENREEDELYAWDDEMDKMFKIALVFQ